MISLSRRDDTVRGAAVLLALAASGGAVAESPSGCNSAAVAVAITPASNGVPLPPGGWVLPGQRIEYLVLLCVPTNDPNAPDVVACDAADGQLGATLPDWTALPLRDDQFVPLAGYSGTSLPEIPPFGNADGAGPLPLFEVPYVVEGAHADDDGLLNARVDYGQTQYLDDIGLAQNNGVVLGAVQLEATCASTSAVPLAMPGVALSVDVQPAQICRGVPTQVTWTYAVTNLSTVPLAEEPPALSGIAIVDVDGSELEVNGPFGDDGDGQLGAGETWTYERTSVESSVLVEEVEVLALALDVFGQPVEDVAYTDAGSAALTVMPDANGDGAVGVDDVIAVVLAWGSDEAGADVNADGMVDADDLMAVILAWGESGC